MHVQLRWNWRHLLVVLVKKNLYFSQKKPFPVSTSSLHSQVRWSSPSLEVHIGQKNLFISQKKPFHVSTEACNLRRSTYSCPCRVQGAPSWVLDAIGQSGLSLSLAGAVSMELLGTHGQYGDIQPRKIGYVCLLACTLFIFFSGLRTMCFFE